MSLLTILGVLITLFVDPNADRAWKFAGCIIFILFFGMIFFAILSYKFYKTFDMRIIVKRQLQGTGLTPIDNFIVFENPGFLRDNVLLTLFSDSSGTEQALAVLQVLKAIPGEDIQAGMLPMGNIIQDLSQYFDGNNKTALYAKPLIHMLELQRQMNTFAERSSQATNVFSTEGDMQ